MFLTWMNYDRHRRTRLACFQKLSSSFYLYFENGLWSIVCLSTFNQVFAKRLDTFYPGKEGLDTCAVEIGGPEVGFSLDMISFTRVNSFILVHETALFTFYKVA
jgi:hypothetical protein